MDILFLILVIGGAIYLKATGKMNPKLGHAHNRHNLEIDDDLNSKKEISSKEYI